jgi:DNA-binding response OmpR family regulator
MAKILIVDVQQCVRELLSEELITEGYQVAVAADADSVSGHLRFSQTDLVLLDLYLDEAEGFSVLHDIKRQDPHLPVIIFTAYDNYRKNPLLSQADGYVIKSIVLDELKAKIDHLLRRKVALQLNEKPDPHCPELRLAHGF